MGISANQDSAHAADFIERPDLLPYLNSLQRLYPAQGPSSIYGKRSQPDPDFLSTMFGGNVFREENPDFASRVVEIRGTIQSGDAKKLSDILAKGDYWPLSVVFNSPGGNFLEAFQIAEAIFTGSSPQDPRPIRVFVLRGMPCLSACAIAFALVVPPDERDVRFVEEGAQLGFHVASLPPEQMQTREQVGRILNLSYDIADRFNQLLLDQANPPELLEEILKHRSPTSFFVLDGSARTWKLGFSPVSSSISSRQVFADNLGRDALAKLCQFYHENGKMYVLAGEVEWTFGGSDFRRFEPRDFPTGGRKFYALGDDEISCGFRFGADNSLSIAIWRGPRGCLEVEEDEKKEEWCAVEGFEAAPVTVAMLAHVLGCPLGQLDPGLHAEGDKLTISTRASVNLRALPSTQSEVLRILDKDEEHQVDACMITDDAQSLWYRLTASGQKAGWISARFASLGYVYINN
ncbi:MAG: SH3 domain-containing protein [Pseudomonadota bacterium]